MNLSTNDGGDLVIGIDHKVEWLILTGVLEDAGDSSFDLAASVGAPMAADEHAADWDEWVLPDLREAFAGHLSCVARDLAPARDAGLPVPGSLTISRDAFQDWYAALNHARLALHSRGRLHPPGDDGDAPPAQADPAWLRGEFYGLLQSTLLDLGLG